MRRAIPVIAATAGGLALLANFRTSPSASNVAISSAGNPSTASEPPTGSRGPPTAPPGTPVEPRARTLAGPAIATEWGDVQVRVLLAGTKMVDVQALKLPFEAARSLRISQAVEPLLREEVLKAQSARIDVVSGATYTSEGYITSLQNALG